jgi:hypothetical protein
VRGRVVVDRPDIFRNISKLYNVTYVALVPPTGHGRIGSSDMGTGIWAKGAAFCAKVRGSVCIRRFAND